MWGEQHCYEETANPAAPPPGGERTAESLTGEKAGTRADVQNAHRAAGEAATEEGPHVC